MLQPFNNSDLNHLHTMICDTIDFSYSIVYPTRAVQFFKDHHSPAKILERSQKGEIVIIEGNDSIVATGTLIKNEISALFVKPDCQGQGFGKVIMNELESRAKNKGFSVISLDVSLPSRGFYEKLGYKILPEQSLDVGEGQHLKYWHGIKLI